MLTTAYTSEALIRRIVLGVFLTGQSLLAPAGKRQDTRAQGPSTLVRSTLPLVLASKHCVRLVTLGIC